MSAGGMGAATDHEIRKIRELSDELLGHPDRLFSEISAPETSAEARLMLGALHKVRNGGKPLAGAETSLVSMIEDVKAAEYDGPPEVRPHFDEKPQEPSDRTPVDREALAALEADPEPEAPQEPPEPVDKRTAFGAAHAKATQKRSRRCQSCSETKPIDDFAKWARGHKKICLDCEADDTPDPESDVEDQKLIVSLLDAAAGWTMITEADLDALRQALIERGDFDESDGETRWQQRKAYLLEEGRQAGYAEALTELKQLVGEAEPVTTYGVAIDPDEELPQFELQPDPWRLVAVAALALVGFVVTVLAALVVILA